jgi:hypothetical protein
MNTACFAPIFRNKYLTWKGRWGCMKWLFMPNIATNDIKGDASVGCAIAFFAAIEKRLK